MLKLTKHETYYTDRGTKSEHCEACTHFRGSDECEIVSGSVARYGWCNRFKRDESWTALLP